MVIFTVKKDTVIVYPGGKKTIYGELTITSNCFKPYSQVQQL